MNDEQNAQAPAQPEQPVSAQPAPEAQPQAQPQEPAQPVYEVGQVVETVHGVKAKVLKVDQRTTKKKKGVVIEAAETWYLLESGQYNTWFPANKIKGVVNG